MAAFPKISISGNFQKVKKFVIFTLWLIGRLKLALVALVNLRSSTGVPLHNWDNVQPESVIVNGILKERLNLYAFVLRFPGCARA